MTTLLIVDSDILIAINRRDHLATEYLDARKLEYSLAISAITQMELLVGARSKAHMQVVELSLQSFHIIDVTPEITRAAVNLIRQYRFSHGLALPDALIAATAMVNKIPLATRNQRDFRFISGLALLPYPKPMDG